MASNKQRREAERRRLQRQVQRRAARDVRRRRITLIVSIIGALAIVGVVVGFVVANTGNDTPAAASSSSSGSPSPSTSPSSSPAKAASYPCTWTAGGTASKTVKPPTSTTPPKSGTTQVSVDTSQGALTFTLNRAAAPCAVASFVSLAQQHYFDATSCHRLTTAGIFVLQCGDPTGTGSGGPGYSFKDELTGKEKYTRGVLAMANSGPDTNGSQFFIVYKDSTTLGPNYTIFGTVSKGLDVVDKVAAKGSTPAQDGKPKLPVELKTLTVAN